MRMTEHRRTVRWRPIKKLNEQVEVSGGIESIAAPTDHTHTNKSFLDNLNIDNSGRLTNQGTIISTPLLDEQW